MAQSPTNCRERNASIATRRFGNQVSGLKLATAVSTAQNMQRHAVLDTSSEVQILALCIDSPVLAFVQVVDAKKGRVSDESRDLTQFIQIAVKYGSHYGSRLMPYQFLKRSACFEIRGERPATADPSGRRIA
jgi:hypothetical protein